LPHCLNGSYATVNITQLGLSVSWNHLCKIHKSNLLLLFKRMISEVWIRCNYKKVERFITIFHCTISKYVNFLWTLSTIFPHFELKYQRDMLTVTIRT
jgi:hypothetical protein